MKIISYIGQSKGHFITVNYSRGRESCALKGRMQHWAMFDYFGAVTLSIITLGINTFSIMTISIIGLIPTLSIIDTWNKMTFSIKLTMFCSVSLC
jgi:hypothetical protein